MQRLVSIDDRRFFVIRSCKSLGMTEEKRCTIKDSNPLIDIVLDDGRGNMLFCHEARVVEYRTEGTQETQGVQGLQGFEGTQGTQGVQGLQGFEGTQETQGVQGPQDFIDPNNILTEIEQKEQDSEPHE
jgi:hypothetical protein